MTTFRLSVAGILLAAVSGFTQQPTTRFEQALPEVQPRLEASKQLYLRINSALDRLQGDPLLDGLRQFWQTRVRPAGFVEGGQRVSVEYTTGIPLNELVLLVATTVSDRTLPVQGFVLARGTANYVVFPRQIPNRVQDTRTILWWGRAVSDNWLVISMAGVIADAKDNVDSKSSFSRATGQNSILAVRLAFSKLHPNFQAILKNADARGEFEPSEITELHAMLGAWASVEEKDEREFYFSQIVAKRPAQPAPTAPRSKAGRL